MTNTKKTMRFLTVFALIFAMVLSGALYIKAEYDVTTADILYPDKPRIVLEIRSTDGTVLARDSYSTLCLVGGTLQTRAVVNKGQKVQIYTSVYDDTTGVWYDAKVQYKHWIVTKES